MQSQTGNPYAIRLQSGRQLKWAFQIRASVHRTQLTFAEQKKGKKTASVHRTQFASCSQQAEQKILLSLIDQSGTNAK